MSQDVDIKTILQKSTSDVPLSELAKKGFKQVKVLNRDVINGLIEDAVARVVQARSELLSNEEKDQIQSASRDEFKRLLNKVRSDEHRKEASLQEQIDKLESDNQHLLRHVQERDELIGELEKQLARAQGEVEALKGAPREELGVGQALKEVLLEMRDGGGRANNNAASDLGEIKNSIEKLVSKVARGMAGSDDPLGGFETEEAAVEFMLGHVDKTVENNVCDVTVRDEKAGKVSDTLKKLRSLQGGGD